MGMHRQVAAEQRQSDMRMWARHYCNQTTCDSTDPVYITSLNGEWWMYWASNLLGPKAGFSEGEPRETGETL